VALTNWKFRHQLAGKHKPMKLQIHKYAWLGLLTWAVAGCQSGKFTHYTAPQISGRVLAADTQKPLAKAQVQRADKQKFEPFGSPKGGEILMQNNGVQTDAGGRFMMPAESVISVFRQPGMWSVPLIVSCSGYESFATNYSGTDMLKFSATGVPEVDAGDILLKPVKQ
jgi:hypothetical protein